MYCIHCGKQIDEGNICETCAAARSLPYDPEKEPAYEQTAQPEPVFTLNDPSQAPAKGQKPSRPKKFPIAAVIVAVVLVGVAAAAVLFRDSLSSVFVRNFGSPEEYLAHVEEKEAQEQIDSITDAYGKLLGALGTYTGTNVSDKVEGSKEELGDFTIQSQIQFEIGDDVLEMLEPVLADAGMDMDLAWLSDIRLTLLSNTTGDLTQADMGIGLGKNSIATLRVLMDMAKGDMYMGVDELSDTYLFLHMEDYTEGVQLPDVGSVQQQINELAALLPGEAKINELLNRYYGIVLENVRDVEKSTEAVEVDGVEQKLNVISCTVTQEDILNIGIAILKDVQGDKELMEALYGIAAYTVVSAEEAVDEAISLALENMDDMLDACEKGNRIELTTYIDNSDNIVGRTIEIRSVDSEKIEISYVTVWSKNEFAFEAEIADMVEITGTGSREKNILEGSFEVEVQGQSVAELELSDYDEKAAEEGYLNATLKLTPSEEIMDMIIAEVGGELPQLGAVLDIAKLSLEVKLASSETSDTVGLRIKAAGATLLGFSITGEKVKPTEVKLPQDTVTLEDQQALQEWIMGMDFDQIIDNLEKADVPDVIMDAIYQVLNQLETYK